MSHWPNVLLIKRLLPILCIGEQSLVNCWLHQRRSANWRSTWETYFRSFVCFCIIIIVTISSSNTVAFNLIIIIIIPIDVVEEQSNLNWGDANQSKSIYIEGTVLHFKFENRLRRGERPSGDMSSNGLIMTQQFLWRNYILLFLWFLPWSQTLLDLQITSWECLNAKPKESKIINNQTI